MANKDQSIFEKALLGWTDFIRAPMKATASKETLDMFDESVKAYLEGETLKGMGLALSSSAQGMIELHKTALYAVVDAFSVSAPPPSSVFPSSTTQQQQRIRRYHD